MAVIGQAEIIVRAITKNFDRDIRKSLKGISGDFGRGAGKRIGDGFTDGFNRSNAKNVFGKVADGLRSMVPEAEAAREKFQRLMRLGYLLSGVLGILAGAISAVAVSIGPLLGSLIKMLPAITAVFNAFVTLRTAMAVAKTAFGDIFAAVKKATKTNSGYTKSLKEIREEWQQLMFDAEAAAYSEEEAALNLERAFENLRRMADLPPNSAARRQAELELKKADLAFRRAKDRTQDLNEVLEDGYDAFAKSKQTGGSNPFEDLNAAQEAFARRLVLLQPALDRVELKMSEAFLAPLYETVDVFEQKLLPIFEIRLPEIAARAGNNIDKIFDRAATPENLLKLDEILVNMQPQLEILGDIFSNILDIILSILVASNGITMEFLTWLSTLTGSWSDSLNMMGEDGSLTTFFDEAGDEAASWGRIIGNIFDGLINLMNLTTGPGSAGEAMLTWFTEATNTFANMFSEDPDAGKEFFKNAMDNARAVFSSIGALIQEILDFADNPAIKEFSDILKEGAPATGEMLEKLVEAGPAFATFIRDLFELLNSLTDDNQINAFFETLSIGIVKFREVLESPLGKTLFDNIGPIAATMSALGLMFDAVRFAFQVLVGYMIFGLDAFQKALDPFKKGFSKAFGPVIKLFNSPLKGGLLAVLIILIAKTIEFYNEFENFREMVDSVVSGIGDAFGNLGESLGGLFEALAGEGGLGGLLAMLDPIIKRLLETVIPFIGGVLEFVINAIATAINFITSIVKSVMDVVGMVIDGIKRMFEGDLMGGLGQIVMGVVTFIVGIVQAILNAIITVINGFLDFINGAISMVANSPAGKALGLKPIGKIGLLDLTGAIKGNFASKLDAGSSNPMRRNAGSIRAENTRFSRLAPQMAKGGTVFPSMGGTVVNVAEAGRPERIEPLDPNGLSQRDKAMIKMLAPGAGGINITVNPSPGMDEKELAAIVSRRLGFEIRRGTI